jgi:hypothetical protein
MLVQAGRHILPLSRHYKQRGRLLQGYLFIGTKSYQHQAATIEPEAHSTYILLESVANVLFCWHGSCGKKLMKFMCSLLLTCTGGPSILVPHQHPLPTPKPTPICLDSRATDLSQKVCLHIDYLQT